MSWISNRKKKAKALDRGKDPLQGRIFCEQSNLSMYVKILDMTSSGAEVKQTFGCILPTTFCLEIHDPKKLYRESRSCALRWQTGDLIGVAFLSDGQFGMGGADPIAVR
jgi:hypothetical protein